MTPALFSLGMSTPGCQQKGFRWEGQGHFWLLPSKGQGPDSHRSWMRDMLAFSCETLPDSGAILHPLLFYKDTERYFKSPFMALEQEGPGD